MNMYSGFGPRGEVKMYSFSVHFWKKTKSTRCQFLRLVGDCNKYPLDYKTFSYLTIRRFTLPFVAQFSLTL